jgi:hypothetical protein
MCRAHICSVSACPAFWEVHGCNTFRIFSKRLSLRHIGDVTVVLSKKGRNVGLKQTKILVTNPDEWTPSQVVCAYQRRWPMEHINRELTTDLGLGAHQVRGEEGRIEYSFGIAVLAEIPVQKYSGISSSLFPV